MAIWNKVYTGRRIWNCGHIPLKLVPAGIVLLLLSEVYQKKLLRRSFTAP